MEIGFLDGGLVFYAELKTDIMVVFRILKLKWT